MNIDKAILKNYKHLQEVVRCAVLHGKGKRNVDIANKLNMAPVRVTRNLQEAIERGIIRIEVHPLPEVEIAEKFKQVYGLKEAYVFPIGIDEEITDILAKLSATYLEKLLDDEEQNIKSVAIGAGRTPLSFVRALSSKRRPNLKVSPMSFATVVETYMASNILIGIPAGKWECELHRFDPEMSVEEQGNYADIFVFGIEKIPDMDSVTALALLSEAVGIDKSELSRELSRLHGRGGIAIINYQPIDEDGKPLDWDLEGYKIYLEPTVMKLDMIRQIAKDGKRVICIAGGEDKVRAIKAGLRGKYFNILITDYETAKSLLDSVK